jgi:hypothetical protein
MWTRFSNDVEKPQKTNSIRSMFIGAIAAMPVVACRNVAFSADSRLLSLNAPLLHDLHVVVAR